MLLFLISGINYRMLTAVTAPFYVVMLGLLAVVCRPAPARAAPSAERTVGELLFLQPSELIKLAVILMLARYLTGDEQDGPHLHADRRIGVAGPAVVPHLSATPTWAPPVPGRHRRH